MIGGSVPSNLELPLGYRPHIVHALADDFGWANVGWNRVGEAKPDVRTPTLDALASEGIRLDRFYTHQICSPSRCALQTGRAPIHVNVQNVPPETVNPADKVGGYQGIPTNMTGLATVLRRAGYRTRMVGKWDAGMATPAHHPRARGYESWLGYWHHANDYWQMSTLLTCDSHAPHLSMVVIALTLRQPVVVRDRSDRQLRGG